MKLSRSSGYNIDLHTHSIGSPDGGMTAAHYRRMLEIGPLDYCAITDHDSIDAAQSIKNELGELGNRIIIGEEISTSQGEIIGLYLTEAVPAGLTPLETVQRIKAQGGLVYVPHPFETVRSGMPLAALDVIISHVDIIETANGRAVFQNMGRRARRYARLAEKAQAASSDAHGRVGWGRTYSRISTRPTAANLVEQLCSARQVRRTVGVGVSYPKINRLKKRIETARSQT